MLDSLKMQFSDLCPGAGSARREVLELRSQRAAAATALASVDGRLAGLVAELGALGRKVAALEAGDGAITQVPSLALVFRAACKMRRT